MYLQEYTDYWEGLIAQHAKIKQFYRLNFEEVKDALKEDIIYPVLVLDDYYGEIVSSPNGSKYMDLQHGSIMLLDIFAIQDYNDENDRLSKLKAYGFGLFAKILEDINTENCPRLLLDLQPKSIKYQPVPYVTEHVKGWIFEFDFLDRAEEFIVNPNDWN